ncbi:hypothetical protein [Paenibacillus sp. 8b26]|uniref:hypothetical protein n=1 Tax=Paenibacillus sp. 8b26 TaxID=3424133 RepID=UPI003D64B631
MRTLIADPAIHAYPGMVAVVTSRHDGVQNIMSSGWHTYIGSSPGMYGISLRKETYPDISKLDIPLYVGRSTYFVADDTLQKKVHPFYLNK